MSTLSCQMTLDALKINPTFEVKFGTLNYKDEVWPPNISTYAYKTKYDV